MSKKSAQTSAPKKHRGLKFTAGLLFGLIAIGGTAYGVDLAVNKDNVPRGATVGGIEIGGMSKQEAMDALQAELDTTRPIHVTAGNADAMVDPEVAGLAVNWEATVDGAGEQSRSPWQRLTSFFRTYEIDVVSDIDPVALIPEVQRVTQDFNFAPVNAGLNLVGGTANIEPQALAGQAISQEDVQTALEAQWLAPEGIELDVEFTEPEITQDVAERARDGVAQDILTSDLVAHGHEATDGLITVDRMHEFVSFNFENGELVPIIDTEIAQNILNERLAPTEIEMRNASVSINGDSVTMTPSIDGVVVDWEVTMKGFNDRVLSTNEHERSWEVAYRDDLPTFTTEMAERTRFDDVVGEFTTSGFTSASGVNIAKVADMVDGAIVIPGETFSLNGYTGPRGTAQGFVESGVILNGVSDTAVGGGISQFATTLYNAAYFAGLEDVTHTPHSFYISRYPAGREATVYEGAIDLQFKNTFDTPVLIRSFVSGNEVTVRMYGIKYVDVESVNNGRWDYTSPSRISQSGANCAASSGSQGFTTSDTRIIRDRSGAELSRETTTTVYDPQPIVTCS
ncbi:MAG: VanW family protein [Corynebacterium sp.]|nr:VanW family protein [Corynebacterium sp.]